MKNSDTNGFTLIELMITLVIMSILLAVAAPNFTNWMDSSKLKSLAESLSSSVSLARSNSLKTNSITTLTIDPSLGGNLWWIDDSNGKQLYSSSDIDSVKRNISVNVDSHDCSVSPKVGFSNSIGFNGLGNVVGYRSYDILFTNDSNKNISPLKLHISPSGNTYTCLSIDDANNVNSCQYKQIQRGDKC